MTQNRAGQNVVAKFGGNSSLPQNVLKDYLLDAKQIRVHSTTALPTGTNPAGTKETEATWSLMMHMSESLGVNCTTCHNSRAFNAWDESPPQRVTAWHGIRMVRDVNANYMVGLTPVFPATRKGPKATSSRSVAAPATPASRSRSMAYRCSRTTSTRSPRRARQPFRTTRPTSPARHRRWHPPNRAALCRLHLKARRQLPF